jgi:hypothetical protein
VQCRSYQPRSPHMHLIQREAILLTKNNVTTKHYPSYKNNVH